MIPYSATCPDMLTPQKKDSASTCARPSTGQPMLFFPQACLAACCVALHVSCSPCTDGPLSLPVPLIANDTSRHSRANTHSPQPCRPEAQVSPTETCHAQPHLRDLLRPLLPEHLGLLALAYNAADGPARAALASSLLLRNFGLHIQAATIDGIFQHILHWGSMRLICEAGQCSLWTVPFHVQPRHLANDFKPLLVLVQRDFQLLCSRHKCPLLKALPLIVLQGKAVQRRLLRLSLGHGHARRLLHRLYGPTSERQQVLPEPSPSSAPRGIHKLSSDPEPSRQSRAWVAHARISGHGYLRDEPAPRLVRNTASGTATSCSRDPRRGTPETVSRKSGGALIAVGPCLHVPGVTPMYSSESLTQVAMFVWTILNYCHSLQWAIYDFACGMLPFLARRSSSNQAAAASLRWVLDRLSMATLAAERMLQITTRR